MKNCKHRRALLTISVAGILFTTARSFGSEIDAQNDWLREVIVTAPRMQSPLVVETDPKAPRQPIPANDGADYLKNVPGFAVIRKGGTDGDPVFRGMAASRVNLQLDGEQILGGCGMRMDPPTAYVFPETYDRVVVIKGPQTVLYGPGNSAATVLFERKRPQFEEAGLTGDASVLGATAGRADLVGDAAFGNPSAYGRVNANRAESDGYEDGAGRDVHSGYMRWNVNGAIGYTPGKHSRLEISGARSNGEAAYADRSMDGALFERDNVGLRYEIEKLGGLVQKFDARAYYNYIDHVMDNYSLRTFAPSMMMPNRAASNPDRQTVGGRVAIDLGTEDKSAMSVTVGMDAQENRHRIRSTMNELILPYETLARVQDARFRNYGVFGELTIPFAEAQRIVTGARVDRWYARDYRSTIALNMGMMNLPNPTVGAERNQTLSGGFARWEIDGRETPMTWFAGVGHVERFPDYWEAFSDKETAASLSAFGIDPERTTQLDVGAVYSSRGLQFSLSGFYSDIGDFILIRSRYMKGARMATIARNVDATTYGAEADVAFAWTSSLKLTGTLAYTHGENDTDKLPLAQMPPLEARLALDYRRPTWSVGALMRGVAKQDRYAVNQGNIVGQDLGPTAGFAIFSLNGSWRASKTVLVTAGVDNLFDRDYAEHLSRAGAAVTGFTQTTRVNEPGRTAWLKTSAEFR